MHETITGVIIKSVNYQEADKIIEVISQEYGRLSLLARGARKSKKRFMGLLDSFMSLNLLIKKNSKLWILESAECLCMRQELRHNLEDIYHASRLCECVLNITPKEVKAHEIYKLLNLGLDHLNRGAYREAVLSYPQLLKETGIMPDLTTCLYCKTEPLVSGFFNLKQPTGLICPECTNRHLKEITHKTFLGEEVLLSIFTDKIPSLKSAKLLEDFALLCIEAHINKRLYTHNLHLS